MSIFARLGALLAVIMSVTFLSASPSSAVQYEYDVASSMGAGSYTCPQDYLQPGAGCITPTDLVIVADHWPDSKSVAVHWRTLNGAREGLCRLTNGADSFGYCAKSFGAVEYRVGTCGTAPGVTCTSPSQYSFFRGWRQQ